MKSTTRNMWKLIYDRKCGAVVMLSNLVENGMVRLLIFLSEYTIVSVIPI